jgi:hypothetical protein
MAFAPAAADASSALPSGRQALVATRYILAISH